MGKSLRELEQYPGTVGVDTLVSVSEEATDYAYKATIGEIRPFCQPAKYSYVKYELGAPQVIQAGSGSWTRLALGSVITDAGSEWNDITYEFNGESGLYYAQAYALWENKVWNATECYRVGIKFDGAPTYIIYRWGAGGTATGSVSLCVCVSAIIPYDSVDSVSFEIKQISGGPATVTESTGSLYRIS